MGSAGRRKMSSECVGVGLSERRRGAGGWLGKGREESPPLLSGPGSLLTASSDGSGCDCDQGEPRPRVRSAVSLSLWVIKEERRVPS